jgi:hypothetical protein
MIGIGRTIIHDEINQLFLKCFKAEEDISMEAMACMILNLETLHVLGNCEFHLEELDWIANLEKLEILKLEWSRFEDMETYIKDFTMKMFGKLTRLKILELNDVD